MSEEIGRKIPNVMGSQHPDNARAPFFQKSPMVNSFNEMKEAYEDFKTLDTDESMWDWEGKYADGTVLDHLIADHYDFFKKHPLGKDKFLTFRFPNIWQEPGYNIMQAMTTMLTAEDFTHDLHFNRPSIEAILPMTQNAKQIIITQEKFESLAKYKTESFSKGHYKNNPYIGMIPLFENFDVQLSIPKILTDYIKMYHEHFHRHLKYMRVFLACSDTALGNGFLNSILGNKIALTRIGQFSHQIHMPIFPIAGSGSTIFRGGLSPVRIDRYTREYPGLKTATAQSAFRYDYPLERVVKPAIKHLRHNLQHNDFQVIPKADEKTLIKIAKESSIEYHKTLDPLVKDLQPVFSSFPKRRYRHPTVGILSYSRDVDGFKMPRAITYSGSFYSVGIPPEILGVGKTLAKLSDHEKAVLMKYYPDMKADFELLMHYFSQSALNELEAKNSAWKEVEKDVQGITKTFGIQPGPKNSSEAKECQLASELINATDSKTITWLINRQGLLRHFLG
ncbi:phosphoenolpyruvate carboxylase [Acetilactobacillus jinshanensis]|uniref:Phosphoenolpyruvate carboxylase n=1 Tax=Acetilactobacillus jinshanensis TaxID=1720083 RepID=A0A4V1ALM1_9LACO|nr:phosphoenolpyruvate carboxylase [Acetilactobacillus jinshanensis]QBP18079.1 phosphoenolpyruvate carboxylase [Acetilactobacillus jinshanensis]